MIAFHTVTLRLLNVKLNNKFFRCYFDKQRDLMHDVNLANRKTFLAGD